MIGYDVTLVCLLILLFCGTVTVIRHPRDLSPAVIRLSAVAVAVSYVYPLLEVVTNYSKGNRVYASAMPTYTLIPLLFCILLIGSLLIRYRVGKICLLTVSLLTPLLIFNVIQTSVYYITHERSFAERNALYLLGQVGVILLCAAMIRNRTLTVRRSGAAISCLFASGITGLAALYKALAHQNVFGLSLGEEGYFLMPGGFFHMASKGLFILNLVSVPACMIVTALVFGRLQRKKSSKSAK